MSTDENPPYDAPIEYYVPLAYELTDALAREWFRDVPRVEITSGSCAYHMAFNGKTVGARYVFRRSYNGNTVVRIDVSIDWLVDAGLPIDLTNQLQTFWRYCQQRANEHEELPSIESVPPENDELAQAIARTRLEQSRQSQVKPRQSQKRGGKRLTYEEDRRAIDALRGREPGSHDDDIFSTWLRQVQRSGRKLSNPRESFRQLRQKARKRD